VRAAAAQPVIVQIVGRAFPVTARTLWAGVVAGVAQERTTDAFVDRAGYLPAAMVAVYHARKRRVS